MKLLKGLKQPEETSAVNLILRDVGRNFSELRDAHVRQLLLFELKNHSNNAPYQSIFEQLEKLNQSAIKHTEHSMLVEEKEFLALKGLWENNDILNTYFLIHNSDPQKTVEEFSQSYLKSFSAFTVSIESLDPNLLHEWRKRLKDVQYQFELLYDNLNSDIQKHYLLVQELCNVLGELNDYDMMSRWIADNHHELQVDENLYTLLSDELLKQKESLLNIAQSNGKKLYTCMPDQFKDQLL